MHKIKHFYVFILLLFSYLAQAQTYCVGTVYNEFEETLPNTSVLVKDTEGNILHFGFTDTKGTYKIGIEAEGELVVEVNKMSYVKQQQTLTVTKDQKEYQVDFILESSAEVLQDIVIEIENPIKQRGDTLVFDAKAFTTGSEQVVEDLLKNIPGITVEKDGRIKFEDKEIEKVMVDGDDFFNRGYAILTKNMPNKPLDKVEVLRKYSNNKMLKGIEDSDKVALNLTIDEAYQNLWFGDIFASYGLASANRYDVSGNLMNFSKKYKNFLTTGLNNLGINRVGSLDDMFYNNYEMESVRGSNSYPLMGLSSGGPGQLKDYRTRINNAEHISLSTIVPVTKKLKMKFTGFLGFDENYAFNASYSVVNVENTSFQNSEKTAYKSALKKGYLNVFGTYDISATQMLQFSSVYNQGNTLSRNDLTFNEINTLESLDTKNSFFDQKVTYTHKWKEKNVVLIKSRFFSNDLPQYYQINDYLMGDLFSNSPTAVDNTFANQKTFGGVEADFKLKQKKGNLVSFQVGYLHHSEKINSQFRLFEEHVSFQPQDFQSNVKYILGDLYANGAYTWDIHSWKISLRADAHQLYNEWKSTQSNQTNTPFYINPSANVSWEITPTQMLSGNYSYNFSTTDITEVNDTYLLSSSRSFRKGLGTFALTNYQNSGIRYHIRHYLNRYSFSLGVNYSQQNKALSSRSSLEQYSSLSESIFIKGGDRISVNYNSSFYIRKWKSNTILNANYSYSTYFNEINDSDLRKNHSINKNITWEWRTNFKTAFNFHIGTDWSFTKVKAPNFESDFTNGTSFLDVFYKIGERLDAKAIIEHYYFGSLPSNQRNHWFLDVEASYKLKGDKWTVFLKGNNLFNKKEFTTFNVSDIGYSTRSYRLMDRYVTLGAKYRFSL